MTEFVIDIKKNVATFIYSDDLLPLTEAGKATTTRASHVEPHPTKTGWVADMRPSNGPILGANGSVALRGDERMDDGTGWESGINPVVARLEPFSTREAALQAERDWLRASLGI